MSGASVGGFSGMSHPRVLLFDLDGTLTDPSVGIVACLRYALERLGRPVPPASELAALIGPPLRGNFAALLGSADPALIERAVALYRERFAETGLFENRVYPDVPEMLERAQREVGALFVATSKPTVYAERIVERFGLARHFRRVHGAELGGRFEDKRDLVAHLLATEGVAAGAAVLIGDRAVDVRAARANGVRSVGALWGFGGDAELQGADALCAAPPDLAGCLARLA